MTEKRHAVIETFTTEGRVAWPRVLLAGLIVAVVLAVGIASATAADPFNPYNHGWDGTSEFHEDAAMGTITSSDDLAAVSPAETTVFLIAPEPAAVEADEYEAFVQDGGTLVVMDNFGEGGNEVLASLGAEARIHGWLLRDEDHVTEGPNMPIAPTVTDHALTGGAEQLSLNYASVVEPGDATVLARTSEVAYLVPEPAADPDDEATDPAAMAVVTEEEIGNGTVVTVSDPSVAINVMYGEPDNDRFLGGLAGDVAYHDLRHGTSVPPLVAATGAVRASPLAQVLLGVVGVAAVTAGSVVRSRRRPAGEVEETAPSPSTEELVAAVCEDHPEWDRQRVRRVMTALNHAREKRGDR